MFQLKATLLTKKWSLSLTKQAKSLILLHLKLSLNLLWSCPFVSLNDAQAFSQKQTHQNLLIICDLMDWIVQDRVRWCGHFTRERSLWICLNKLKTNLSFFFQNFIQPNKSQIKLFVEAGMRLLLVQSDYSSLVMF